MKLLMKNNKFNLSFFIVFLFFLQRQFFSLLNINLLITLDQNINIIDLLILAILIPISLVFIYYIPVLLFTEILISFNTNVSFPLQIEYKQFYVNYKQKIVTHNRNKEYCTFRC